MPGLPYVTQSVGPTIADLEQTPQGADPTAAPYLQPKVTILNTTGGTITLSALQNLSTSFEVRGALTSNVVVIVANTMQLFTAENLTTGPFTVTFKTANAAGIVVPQTAPTTIALFYANGTAIEQVVQITAAGSATYTGLLTALAGFVSTAGTTQLGTTTTGLLTTSGVSGAVGVSITDPTLATAVTPAPSPILQLRGSGWNTALGAAWNYGGLQVAQTGSHANPSKAKLAFLVSADNLAPAEVGYIDSTGLLSVASATIGAAGFTSTAGTTTLGTTNTGTLTSSSTIKTGGYTVATLPAPAVGTRAYVTDANAPVFGNAVVGGGVVVVPVISNATGWIVG